jgi:hypothetical protein
MARRQRHVEVSGVVQVDAISPEVAAQVDNALSAFVRGRAQPEEPLRISSIYDENIGRMKIILLAGPSETSSALKLISALLEK